MPTSDEAFFRFWHTLRQVPRYPNKATVHDIADGLKSLGVNVSVRTIQRDLMDLARLFPIIVDDRSRPYGWSWAREAKCYDFPGLTSEEALLWVMAETHLKHLLPNSVLDSLSPMFRSARSRLCSPSGTGGKEVWFDKVRVVSPGQALIPPEVDQQVQRVVTEALLHGKQLEILYRRKSATETVTYRIHPLAIVARGVVIYLYARLFDYADARNLALHRIVHARVLEDDVSPPCNFDLDMSVSKGVWGFGAGDQIEICLKFHEGKGDHLKESPLSCDQRIEVQEEPDCVKIHATVANTPQLKWWILGFGSGVEVITPAALRQEVSQEAIKMGMLYQTK